MDSGTNVLAVLAKIAIFADGNTNIAVQVLTRNSLGNRTLPIQRLK